MATVILARHGRTAANASGVLAGRSPGVELDDVGLEQARQASARLAGLKLADAQSSPMQRCQQTLALLLDGVPAAPAVTVNPDLAEVDYGSWTGQKLSELVKEPLWRVIQAQPSAVRFPDGEAMAGMSARVVGAIRAVDAAVEETHGQDAVWLLCSHGDPIKAALADALGMHLDAFQRIVVEPASLSVIRYTERRSFVLAMNTKAGDLAHLTAPASNHASGPDRSDAVVGGGAGGTDPGVAR